MKFGFALRLDVTHVRRAFHIFYVTLFVCGKRLLMWLALPGVPAPYEFIKVEGQVCFLFLGRSWALLPGSFNVSFAFYPQIAGETALGCGASR